MKGAIVFLVFFVLFTAITLQYATLPPGRELYKILKVPDTDQPVIGIPATNLVIALFNGIIYGIIVWLIFTILDHSRKGKKTKPAKKTEAKKFCINCGTEILDKSKYCSKCGASQ
ncbi:zinc ribbon domain-containing protein [Candidatus Bathyarchaeota archaeon]|nr:zinc ribbon domain-containing protein [Candidatus Bathyarchaeota archaeon]